MINATIEKEKKAISKIPTKERILKAAFELSVNTGLKAVSLNEIAKKAGIAKPGIFRYYKSKDDLQETMKNRFFDDFCTLIRSLPTESNESTEKNKNIFENRETLLLEWFIEKYEYLCFFLNTLVEGDDFIPTFIYEIQKRNFSELGNQTLSLEKINKKNVSAKLYLRTTEIFFLLARAYMIYETPEEIREDSHFTPGVIALLSEGWKELESISEERVMELEALCNLEEEDFSQENKMFQALSSLLENYSMAEITVEKMASELGMAKSSLYSHFINKEEMLKSLIESELMLMLKSMEKVLKQARSFSEYIFLHMRSQMEYLSRRQSLIPICKRLSVQGFLPEKFLKDFFENMTDEDKKEFEIAYPFPSVGFPIDGFIMGGWIFSLCVTAFKLGDFFNFSSNEIMNTIKDYYIFMKDGVKNSLTE